jgi:hypothetical protein
VISQIDSRRAQLAGAIFLYVVAMAFEGFWLAGAYFFSDGRDEAVQAAIIVWWCAFAAVIFLSVAPPGYHDRCLGCQRDRKNDLGLA